MREMMKEVSSKDEVDISLLTAELYVCIYVNMSVCIIIVHSIKKTQ